MIRLNDLLWDNKLKIFQDDKSFKYSMDSVLLSNFVVINQSVKNILDIGTGNAPIPLLLSLKTTANIVGVEIQENSAYLAKKSVEYNKIKNIDIINDDINNYYLDMKSDYFDVIVSNPPYFRSNNFKSNNISKMMARNEDKLSINNVVIISKKLLKNGGKLFIICATDRFIDLITCLKTNNIEPKRLQFVYPKKNSKSNVFLIEAIKNGHPGFEILSPIIVHNDDNSFSDEIFKIMTEFGK